MAKTEKDEKRITGRPTTTIPFFREVKSFLCSCGERKRLLNWLASSTENWWNWITAFRGMTSKTHLPFASVCCVMCCLAASMISIGEQTLKVGANGSFPKCSPWTSTTWYPVPTQNCKQCKRHANTMPTPRSLPFLFFFPFWHVPAAFLLLVLPLRGGWDQAKSEGYQLFRLCRERCLGWLADGLSTKKGSGPMLMGAFIPSRATSN